MTKRAIVEVLAGLAERREEKLVRVGRISQELQDALDKLDDDHEAQHEAIKEKIDAFIRKVTEEHSCDPFFKAGADLWEKVYDELGLSEEERGHEYTIKGNTRVVYRKLSDEDDAIEPLN